MLKEIKNNFKLNLSELCSNLFNMRMTRQSPTHLHAVSKHSADAKVFFVYLFHNGKQTWQMVKQNWTMQIWTILIKREYTLSNVFFGHFAKLRWSKIPKIVTYYLKVYAKGYGNQKLQPGQVKGKQAKKIDSLAKKSFYWHPRKC